MTSLNLLDTLSSIILAGWFTSFMMWLYTIIERVHRENGDYVYPYIALQIFSIALAVIGLLKLKGVT